MTGKLLQTAMRAIGSGERGFTLPELVMALTLCMFVMVGGGELLRQVIVASANSGDAIVATIQVQNAAFWINQDAIQAQVIERDDPSSGFPLTLTWTDWENNQHEIIYSMGNTTDEAGLRLWELEREDTITGEMVVVAENLDRQKTRLYWHSTLENVLVLEVTANVGTESASGTYNIQPRALK
jgi:lipopolysaccharide export LptBFGC system permease protein LptF